MFEHVRLRGAIAGIALTALLALAGCGSSSSNDSATSASSTTAAPKTLQILVTNDDGFDAPGIDAVVEGLRALPNVAITVVAPATNQSGKGSTVTAGTLSASDGTTKSGYAAKAVNGTPADTIVWAIDQKGISFTPDLVVSGINAGANLGPVIDLSGTVGAARAAVQRNIAAIATSNGAITGPYAFAEAAKKVAAWVQASRDAIANGSFDRTTVVNMNIPTCATGSIRGEVTVPPSATENSFLTTQPDCTSTATNPASDVAAYMIGYTALSKLSPRPAS